MDTVQFSKEIVAFLAEPNFMILGTLRIDKTIQMTVVWFTYENGLFLISTTTQRVKYKNIVRNPQVTFVIVDNKNPYKFIQVRGTVIISKEGAYDLIDSLSEKYIGSKPYKGDPDRTDQRVVLTIRAQDYMVNGFSHEN